MDVVSSEPPSLSHPYHSILNYPQFYLNTPHSLDWTLHHKKSMEPSPRKYRKF